MKKVIKEDVKKKSKAKSKEAKKDEKKINKKSIIICSLIVIVIVVGLIAIICNNVKKEDENNAIRDEILDFNAEIEKYSGSQMGKDVKELVSYLIENANETEDENELPDIKYVADESAEDTVKAVFSELEDATIVSSLEEPNLLLLSSLRAKINNSHYYNISVSYNETGYISKIIIKY
jgi:flagellar basal body-associated protein FliL